MNTTFNPITHLYTSNLFKRTIFSDIHSPHLFLQSLTLKYPHLIKDSSLILRQPKLTAFLNLNLNNLSTANAGHLTAGNSRVSNVNFNSARVYELGPNINANHSKNTPSNKTEIVGRLFKDIKVGRKELYNILKNQSGIYELVNLKNHKKYIGSSSNLLNRLANYSRKGHLADSASRNMVIASAILTHGWENFGFRILEFIDYDPKLTYNQNSAKI